MRRYGFYILVGLVTFGISLLIVFSFLRKNDKSSGNIKKTLATKIYSEPEIETVNGFIIKESEQQSTDSFQKSDERKKPFCLDKRILPIWSLIKKDEYFLEQSGGLFLNPNCKDMFEVFNFDLNQDGVKEILLRGNSLDLCGAVGNCGFWIFEKKGNNYRKILSSSDYTDITEMGEHVTRHRTNTHRDILLKAHLSAAETRHSTYKFKGQKYTESKCMVSYWIRNTRDNPKSEFISCREYEKRQNY